jgi:hypothetical protein
MVLARTLILLILAPQKAVYMASYHISHKINCFANTNILTLNLYGGSWEVARKIPKNDHLDLALLSDDLSILAETIVTLEGCFNLGRSFRFY